MSAPLPSSFTALVASGDLGLDRACALIAAEEHPGVDPASLIAALDTLATGVRVPPGASTFDATARLVQRVFVELGFTGDPERYQLPESSCLDTVLATRRGLPILLSVVAIEIARRCDVAIEGIGFPGHFLVSPRPAPGEPRFYVDPFNQGRILRAEALAVRLHKMTGNAPEPEFLARVSQPVDHRMILVRINNNLKGAHLRRDDVAGALRASDRLLALVPDLWDEVRDRGLMRAHQGDPNGAAEDLDRYLEGQPAAADIARVRAARARIVPIAEG